MSCISTGISAGGIFYTDPQAPIFINIYCKDLPKLIPRYNVVGLFVCVVWDTGAKPK